MLYSANFLLPFKPGHADKGQINGKTSDVMLQGALIFFCPIGDRDGWVIAKQYEVLSDHLFVL